MTEGTDQPQQYCRNCGAELRSGTAFCVSCGARIENEPEWAASASRTDWDFYHQGSSDSTLSIYQRVVRWFKKLSVTSKVIVVLLAMVVLVSPLLQLVAGLVLAVSIIAILLGLVQGKAVKSWVITGSVSLVLALFSLYILDTPYNTGSGDGGDSSSNSGGGIFGGGYSEATYEIVIGPEEVSTTEDLWQGFAIVETDASESEQLASLCADIAEDFSAQGEDTNYNAIRVRTDENNNSSLGDIAIFQGDEAKQGFDEFYEKYGEIPPYSEYCYF